MPPRKDGPASALSAPRRGRISLESGHRGEMEPAHQAPGRFEALVELSRRAAEIDLRERVVRKRLRETDVEPGDGRVIVAAPHLVDALLGLRPVDEHGFRRFDSAEEEVARGKPEAGEAALRKRLEVLPLVGALELPGDEPGVAVQLDSLEMQEDD